MEGASLMLTFDDDNHRADVLSCLEGLTVRLNGGTTSYEVRAVTTVGLTLAAVTYRETITIGRTWRSVYSIHVVTPEVAQ